MKNQELIDFLNQLLSNYFILYVKLHRYHWYIKGNQFFQLHDYFEDLYLKTQEHLDEVAERIRIIGGKPLATMSMYIKQGTLEEANADDTEEEIISQLCNNLEEIVKEITHIGFPLTTELEDDPTNDMLIRHQKKFENRVWMLQAYQSKN